MNNQNFLLFIFLLVFSSVAFPIFAQDSVNRSEFIEKYRKGSVQEKQRIDSTMADFENEIRATQVKSICGVDFGTPKKEAVKLLKKKFGKPSYSSSENELVFRDVKYAGLDFSHLLFLFQSDGNNSYLNSSIFVKDAKNKEEAEAILELFYSILSDKYNLEGDVDDKGFNYYSGGISPLWDGKWDTFAESLVRKDGKYLSAIKINVIEYSDEIIYTYGNKYGVRIYYGPYQYVKEEF